MPLATAPKIAEHTGIDADVAAKAFVHASKAERECRRLVTSARYDELEDLQDGAPEKERLREAESLMCFYFALPFLNLRPTEKGGLVKSVGFDASRQELMYEQELSRYRAEVRSQAMLLLDDLQITGLFIDSI